MIMKNDLFLPIFFHHLQKKMIEEHSKILSRYELSKVHVPFIMSMNDQKDGICQSELARKLDYNRAHISRTLKDLEERGFVTQEKESIYKNKYFITEKGKVVASLMKEAGYNIKKQIFSALTNEELKEFQRLVKKMTDAL